MGDVKLENGYTRIANVLMEVLPKIGLNGTQHNIIWVVFRYTYGFQRKDHDLSLTFIAKATNSHKMTIQKEISRLIDMNILEEKKAPTFSQSRIIAFNKNINSWQLVKPLTVSKLDTVSQIDNHTVSQLANTTVSELTNQERNNKENIKERPYEVFFNNLWSLYPNKKGKTKISAKQKKKLLDEVGEEKLKSAILKYSSEVTDREPKYIMHGSTFFNSGYEDYLVGQAKELEVKPTGKIRIMSDEDIEEYNRNLEVKLQQGVD